MRLFIAIHFSDQVHKVLLENTKQLKAQVLSATLTRTKNLHLGDTPLFSIILNP